jgi:hypothetical protein
MDWNIILTSIISASFIVALIEFFIKQSYKKLLDKKIEEAKEDIRQKSKVFDLQFNTYVLVDELVYRAKNAARDIKAQLEQQSIDHNSIDETTNRLGVYNDAIIELLFEKRAILGKDVYTKLHDLKHETLKLIHIAKSARLGLIKGNADILELNNQYKFVFDNVDGLYISLNEIIQKKIRVK